LKKSASFRIPPGGIMTSDYGFLGEPSADLLLYAANGGGGKNARPVR
jgi:hypothetical protein